jgi:hypothetical protein
MMTSLFTKTSPSEEHVSDLLRCSVPPIHISRFRNVVIWSAVFNSFIAFIIFYYGTSAPRGMKALCQGYQKSSPHCPHCYLLTRLGNRLSISVYKADVKAGGVRKSIRVSSVAFQMCVPFTGKSERASQRVGRRIRHGDQRQSAAPSAAADAFRAVRSHLP